MVAFSAGVYNFQGYMECNSQLIERLMAEEEYCSGFNLYRYRDNSYVPIDAYAKFYGPSYFSGMGIILIFAGLFSLFTPEISSLDNLEPFMNRLCESCR
jgi:hypothetical protein